MAIVKHIESKRFIFDYPKVGYFYDKEKLRFAKTPSSLITPISATLLLLFFPKGLESLNWYSDRKVTNPYSIL